MADSIIAFVKNKDPNERDTVLCIFGSAHFEGISHYLKQNGFVFTRDPVEF